MILSLVGFRDNGQGQYLTPTPMSSSLFSSLASTPKWDYEPGSTDLPDGIELGLQPSSSLNPFAAEDSLAQEPGGADSIPGAGRGTAYYYQSCAFCFSRTVQNCAS